MKNPNAPRWQQIYAIPGMLIFGTATVVTQKFLFEQTSVGTYGEHKFKKPWFQTDSMFLGMTLSLLAYLILGRRDRSEVDSQDSIFTSTASTDETSKKKKSKLKLYFASMLPAICDLTATSLMNVQLLYINASVWQMLRGSMVIFSSIFCAFILKRPHAPYMWWSVLGTVIALGIVGVAAVCANGAGVSGVSTNQTIMAIFLTILAQLVQATQLVIEDFLLHDMSTHPLQLVGLKGFWGFFWCTLVCIPAVQYIHSEEGNGVHEDIKDTFTMIGNSPLLLVFVVLYVFFILCYNIGGMLVTNVFSAVVRTILEGLRTSCIWIVQLIIYYSLKDKDYGHKHPDVGEPWTIWSYMQLAGFLMLFACSLFYNRILRLPFFRYPDFSASNNQRVEEPLIQPQQTFYTENNK